MKIGYFGDGVGTFSHIASLQIGNPLDDRIGIPSFSDLVEAVIGGRVDRGIIPNENSAIGAIGQSIDSIIHANGNFGIMGKVITPVRHNLIATEKMSFSEIKEVVSFREATPQCREWLKKNLPRAKINNSASSTAAAVKNLCNYGKGTVAIGSQMSANYYGRVVLAKDIHDNQENVTSFFVLSRAVERIVTGNDETSLIISIPDGAGSLYEALGFFRANWWRRFVLRQEPINLSQIESRPARTEFGKYIFFVTFDGHKDEPRVKRTLVKLGEYAKFVKVLGSYPKAD